MTDETTPPKHTTDRIAKVMARIGVASRRDAERMILEGRVSVNGAKIASPALDVSPTDKIAVDGKVLEGPQETRLWLYYKPLGLITSEADEKGRQTVFDALPRDLPRVMTVGRLDLNSEGLLLLTNDGELKRRLELPATGWLRRYRVRVNGTPNDLTFDPLRRGVTIEGEDFAPMEIKLDSQQGANAWLTVGIREGKNREIRRAMAHIGLQVNRLIRVGYGPFKLGTMEKNEVTEVKRRVLRDQLGGLLTGDVEDKPREMRPRGAEGGKGPRAERGGERPARAPGRRGDGEGTDRPRFGAKPRPAREDFASRGEGERPARSFGKRGDAESGGRPKFGDKPRPARDNFAPRTEGDRPARPFGKRGEAEGGDRPRFAGKPRPVREDYAGGGGETARPRGKGAGGAERGPRTGAEGEGARWKKPQGGARGDRAEGGGFAGKPGGPRKPFGAGAPRGAGTSDGAAEPKPFRRTDGKPGGFGGKPGGAGRGPGGKPGGSGKPSGFAKPRDGQGGAGGRPGGKGPARGGAPGGSRGPGGGAGSKPGRK
ncbi:pseudouridine synthase [Paracoccus tibetensis]|uniref:Pseudouridine synthase n=1 Tax=Paracoccus tibetensis TaxID=336292 RepID=A0A1G5BU26_9RHOB|nr:pseudouridine synthase [Paracoccus tibetensis]SCX93735.1 23S rRNA pseudouridine2605 synthase [Paracoccus tibetensis]